MVFAAWGAGRDWIGGAGRHTGVCARRGVRAYASACGSAHVCVCLCTFVCTCAPTRVHVSTYTPSAFQLCRRGGNAAASPSRPCCVAPASLELPNMSELLWNCPGRVFPSLCKLFQPNAPWLSHSSLSRGAVVGRQAGPWCSILLPWEPHSQDFPAGVEKKMVFIESLSAATWTQFAALGGGTEGSGAVGRNQKQPELGSQGLGPVCAPSTSIPLAGCQAARRALGLCCTEHQAQAAHPDLGV